MGGIFYIVICFLAGGELAGALFYKKKMIGTVNQIWTFAASAFGLGTLFLTWAVYLFAWGFSVLAEVKEPLLPANIIVLGGVSAFWDFSFFEKKEKSLWGIG